MIEEIKYGKEYENMDFQKEKEEVSEMKQRTKTKEKNTSCHAVIQIITDYLHLCHRSFAKKAYDRHQELRLQAIETKQKQVDVE